MTVGLSNNCSDNSYLIVSASKSANRKFCRICQTESGVVSFKSNGIPDKDEVILPLSCGSGPSCNATAKGSLERGFEFSRK